MSMKRILEYAENNKVLFHTPEEFAGRVTIRTMTHSIVITMEATDGIKYEWWKSNEWKIEIVDEIHDHNTPMVGGRYGKYRHKIAEYTFKGTYDDAKESAKKKSQEYARSGEHDRVSNKLNAKADAEAEEARKAEKERREKEKEDRAEWKRRKWVERRMR